MLCTVSPLWMRGVSWSWLSANGRAPGTLVKLTGVHTLGALGAQPTVAQVVSRFGLDTCLGCGVPSVFVIFFFITIAFRWLSVFLFACLIFLIILYFYDFHSDFIGARGRSNRFFWPLVTIMNSLIGFIAFEIKKFFRRCMFFSLILLTKYPKFVLKPCGALKSLHHPALCFFFLCG